MTGFDMTSPSISGHHRISLNDGSILFDSLELEAEEFATETASVAMIMPILRISVKKI